MPSTLHRIALFAERHYRSIFLVTLLLVVLSVVGASRLEFDADVLALLPDDDPVVDTFRETLAEFGGLDLLLVIVRLPEDPIVGPYLELVDHLGPALEALPELEYVDYKIGKPDELLRAFFPKAFLFLDDEARSSVASRLTADGMAVQAQELRHILTTPQALARKEFMLLDPLGLSTLFLQQMTGGSGALGVDWTSGHYLARDHRLVVLLAKPIKPPQDLAFNRQLSTQVTAVVEGIKERQWPEIAGPNGPEPPEILLGGGYLTALEDASLIQNDIVVNAVSSMVMVLLLFLFAFRRLGLLLYAAVPLTTGLILAFGFAAVTTGKLSSATSGFAALLIGLGIDFVIVSYGRFVEERNRGRTASEALRLMTGHCGRAVVIGGVTSAATFYAFAVTKFTGLRQMGILTATGILLCMLCVLFLLPAMLAWSEARHRRRDTAPSLFLHGFGADKIVRLAMSRPRPVLVIGLITTLAAVLLLPRLSFESSIRNMRPKGHRGFVVQDLVAKHFGSNFEFMMLVLRGETAEEVLGLAGRATVKAQPMVDAEVLNSVESITRLIPPPEQQEAALAWMRSEREDLLAPEALRARFDTAMTDAGLRAAPFGEGLDLLLAAASQTESIGLSDLDTIEGSDRLLARYLRESDRGWTSVVYLHAPPRIWKRAPPPAAEVLAEELGPNAVLTGMNVLSRNVREQVWVDAVVACVLGAVLVLLLLWVDFRRIGDTLLSMAPLGVGILWMLGGMVAFGIAMNFMNIFVTTMIIGIGVDYGVHMLHRNRELRHNDIVSLANGLAETGKAIVMAAASTIVGFGALVFSHYPGLRSIGAVAILGAVCTAVVAITLLPAYLAWRRGV